MPKMYNPDSGELLDVRGADVKERKQEGFIVVGNRPAERYLDKTREELLEDEDEEEEAPE